MKLVRNSLDVCFMHVSALSSAPHLTHKPYKQICSLLLALIASMSHSSKLRSLKNVTVGIHLTHDGPFFMILASSKPHCVCMGRVHYSTGCTNSFVQYRLWQRALVQRLRSSNITSLVPLHPEHLISTTHIIICDTCTCQC